MVDDDDDTNTNTAEYRRRLLALVDDLARIRAGYELTITQARIARHLQDFVVAVAHCVRPPQ